MSAALRLREDHDAQHMRALAKASRDAKQTRRRWRWRRSMTAPRAPRRRRSAVSRGSPSTSSGVRKWVVAVNAHGPSGLLDGKAPGNRPLLDPAQREALRRIIEAGPIRRAWRGSLAADRSGGVGHAEYRISISEQTLSRICVRWAIANSRPDHGITRRTPRLEEFKKVPERLAEIAASDAPGQPIEVWFQML